jgi:hypothetical protein
MGFGAVESMRELTLGDVGDEAEMGIAGLQVLVQIEGWEMAVIPGAAEQRREVSVAALEALVTQVESQRRSKETDLCYPLMRRAGPPC